MQNSRRQTKEDVSDTMIANYEESAGDMKSVNDRVTIYD